MSTSMTSELFPWLPGGHVNVYTVSLDQGVLGTAQINTSLGQEQLRFFLSAFLQVIKKPHEYVSRDFSVSVTISILRLRFTVWLVFEQWHRDVKCRRPQGSYWSEELFLIGKIGEVRMTPKIFSKSQPFSVHYHITWQHKFHLDQNQADLVQSALCQFKALSWVQEKSWYLIQYKSSWAKVTFHQFLKALWLRKVCLKSFCSTLLRYFWSGTRSPKITCTLLLHPSVNNCWSREECRLFYVSAKVWLMCVSATVQEPSSVPGVRF